LAVLAKPKLRFLTRVLVPTAQICPQTERHPGSSTRDF
jgi:hypothetical protein